MAVLFILGNGFDLYHDLPTRFCNYRDFLKRNHAQLIHDFESFPFLTSDQGEARWGDVETALTLDFDSCLEDALSAYPLDLFADNPGWNDPAIWIESETAFINDFTGKLFYRWLYSIDISAAKNRVVFPSESLFVTFNYTSTLEERYGVSDTDILHIHGHAQKKETSTLLPHGTKGSNAMANEGQTEPCLQLANDERDRIIGRSSIQFGSPYNRSEEIIREIEKQYGLDDFFGAYISPCINPLISFCKVAGKSLEENYGPLNSFLNTSAIQEVFVFGHSFDGVDEPYYSDVLIPRYKSLPWVFVVYDATSKDDVAIFCRMYNIMDYSIVFDKDIRLLDLRRNLINS